MPIEEILIQYGIIVGQCLRQAGEARRWYLLQRRLVCLVPDAAHIENDTVLRVHVDQIHGCMRIVLHSFRYICHDHRVRGMWLGKGKGESIIY